MTENWTTPPDHPMAAVIAQGYDLFDGLVPDSLHICTCCGLSQQDQARLRTRLVSTWPRADLEAWFASAATDPYPHPAWCYILPRLLDALVAGVELPLSQAVFLARAPTGQRAL